MASSQRSRKGDKLSSIFSDEQRDTNSLFKTQIGRQNSTLAKLVKKKFKLKGNKSPIDLSQNVQQLNSCLSENNLGKAKAISQETKAGKLRLLRKLLRKNLTLKQLKDNYAMLHAHNNTIQTITNYSGNSVKLNKSKKQLNSAQEEYFQEKKKPCGNALKLFVGKKKKSRESIKLASTGNFHKKDNSESTFKGFIFKDERRCFNSLIK